MPHDPAQAAQRTRRYFGTGERDSGIEHLVHLSRLADVRSSCVGRPAEAPAPMASRHEKRQHDMEAHIRADNAHLFEKLVRHRSIDARRKHKLNLVPIEKQTTFFQGSNQHARVLDAARIDEQNGVLLERLAGTRPFLSRRQLQAAATEHDALVKRISRFKPQQPFAGADLLFASVGRSPRRDQTSGSDESPRQRRGWQPLWTHDVREMQRAEDSKLRGGLTPRATGDTRRIRDPNSWCNRDEPQCAEHSDVPRAPPRPAPPAVPRRVPRGAEPTVFQQGGVFHQLTPHRPQLAAATQRAPPFVAANPPEYDVPRSSNTPGRAQRGEAAEVPRTGRSDGCAPQEDAAADPADDEALGIVHDDAPSPEL